MNHLRTTLLAAASIVALGFPCSLPYSRVLAQNSATQNAPDDAKQNQNQNQNGTADNQPNAKSDLQITAKIRRTIISDKNLSTYAHNVKIITANGAVTLKGPVKSDEEKQQVASDAASVVSADKVTNQLTVKQ